MTPLQAADWRFFVPEPPGRCFQHVVVVGGSAGIAMRLTSLGLAKRVDVSCPTTPSADLVVARHDARVPVAQLAGAVAPGGWLYIERDRAQAGAPSMRDMAATLQGAGLRITQIYAVEPAFDDPRAFLPLDSPLALDWFARTHFSPQTMREWRISQARRVGFHFAGQRVLNRFPHLVVVATSSDTTHQQPHALASTELRQALTAQLAGAVAAPPIIMTEGRDRVVFLPRARGLRDPVAVVKVPKTSAFGSRTAAEHAALTTVRRRLPDVLASAVPEAHVAVRIGDVPVSVQSFVRGRVVASAARDVANVGRRRGRELQVAMEWLVEMHRSTELSRPRWSELEHAARVDERLSTWNDTFGADAATGALFEMVQATSTTLRDECLPLVFQHGDFNVWNLLTDRGHVGVIDWEGAADGLPLCDAFQLIISWLHAVSYPRDRLAERLAVRDIFIAAPASGIAPLAARRALTDYIRRMRIDPRFVPLLLVLHRIELVARRIEQSRLQGEETRDGRQIPEHPVVSMLAAHAHALFARDWSTAP